MKSKHIISCFVAVQVIATAAIPSFAQPSNGASLAVPPSNHQMSGGPGRFAEGLRPFFAVLTDEQRASLEPVMRPERDKLFKTEMKLREARKELLAIGLSKTFDEEAVRKQALAAAELEAEIDVLRIKALSQVKPPLSPEQLEKIQNIVGMPAQGLRLTDRPGNRRALTNTNRDENDLPPKP